MENITPLEALYKIEKKLDDLLNAPIFVRFTLECKIVEKSLKALEIIKKKGVNAWLFHCGYNLIDYNDGLKNNAHYNERELTQEEYDLLKEVLN